jgi:predicted Fe-Mo cluster-binding NifX family protein
MHELSQTRPSIGNKNGASAELTIKYRKLNPYTTGEINVLLLENVSQNAVKIFQDAGFNVPPSLPWPA